MKKNRDQFEQGLNHPDLSQFENSLLAGAHQEWVEHLIERTDGTIDVLPQSLVSIYESKLKEGLWIEANSLLVGIKVKSLASLKNKIDMAREPFIATCEYSDETGLHI